jgi:hypothetical protein
MPSNEELLEAFGKAKDSVENMIRFGSLIEDLECYVDNTPYFKNGQLIGRRGGIRRYLEREIPELYARYKTVMKYKALSRKFRQATGIADPIPAASLIPEKEEKELYRKNENSVRNEFSREDEMDKNRTDKSEISTKTMLAREILEACEGSIISLAAQVEMRINPDYTPAIHTSGISHDITANGKRQDLSSCRPTQRRYSPSHQCA